LNILHIDCSPRRQSHSRRLSADIVAQLLAARPHASICRRDLGLDPIPHMDSGYAAVLSSPAALAAGSSSEAMYLSEQLIQEVEASHVIVIGTPMNNFTVPSVLKAWLDQVIRVGRTVLPTPAGKVGMLHDRPVLVGIASGGVFTGDWANQPDFLMPYLSAALGCVGLTSLHFLPVQATALLDEEQVALARRTALAAFDATGTLRQIGVLLTAAGQPPCTATE
jgi:FMN-dependent NADH-azoreductase